MRKKIKQMLQGIAKKYCGHEVITIDNEELSAKEKAYYAKQLLINPLWGQLLEEVKQEAISQCEISPARDVEGREYYWKYVKAIEQLKGRIASCRYEEMINEKREKESPASQA